MANSITQVEGPQGIVAITPSDSVSIAKPIRGFMVGAAGDVSVEMVDGTSGVYPSCLVGIQYVGSIYRINSTNTTATGIVGFY